MVTLIEGKVSLDKEVSRRQIRFYLLALLALGVLAMAGQFLIQNFLNDAASDAHVVNIAGRQRMLSQRLTKTAILLVYPQIYQPNAEQYNQNFGEIITLWSDSHLDLKKGNLNKEKVIYFKNSPKIDSMFRDLDPVFNVIYQNANLIHKNLNVPIYHSDKQNSEALNHILANETMFLKKMDEIVSQYDSEAQQRVGKLKNTESWLFVFTILVLIIEGLFIFRPLFRYINKVIRQLSDSETELQNTNNQLINTQEALLKTTEEKFKLKRQEDNIRSASLIEGQEEERKRIALELHDGIGQMLTGLKLDGERLRSMPFANEKQKTTIEEHQKLIDETIEATRTISFNLMPSVLSDFGLIAALRLLAEQTEKSTKQDIKFEYKLDDNSLRLGQNTEINLYRIAQEAVNNAVKHAKASEIILFLSQSKQHVSLCIKDNGIGFDEQEGKAVLPSGSGIKNMQTRVRLLEGSFKMITKTKKGTEILVRLSFLNH